MPETLHLLDRFFPWFIDAVQLFQAV
jgi:hypothetical protein